MMSKPTVRRKALWLAALASGSLAGCGDAEPEASPAQGGGSGKGSAASGAGGSATGGQGLTGGQAGVVGVSGSGGSGATGAAGRSGTAGTSGVGESGRAGSGAGAAAGTSGAAGASASGAAGSAGGGGGCAMGPWPVTDPAVAGPFETVTEENVGPAVGEGEETEVGEPGAPVAFTLFRPADLSESGLCHPVITWGNGTGSTPSLYGVLLRHLASHGFVVIASDSPNVARGEPPPMVAGVNWVIEQNDDPMSPLYGRIDATHVGATGHSQGGFATTSAAGDSQITTMAPLCGASQQRNLHGPAFLFCGGEDEVVDCEGIHDTFDGITGQPAMFANYLTGDHANWITFRGTTLSPVEVAVTAWMRVQLMNDTALRPWFYGASCALCTDAAWAVEQKGMDP